MEERIEQARLEKAISEGRFTLGESKATERLIAELNELEVVKENKVAKNLRRRNDSSWHRKTFQR